MTTKKYPWSLAVAAAIAAAGVAMAGPLAADAPNLTDSEAKALKNPNAYTAKSVSRGRVLFMTSGCTSCHGNDGKALIEVVANATNLTDAGVFKHGTGDGEIFRSIRDGAGVSMPPFKGQITEEEDVWHLVNFVKSLWPNAPKPAAD